MVWRDAERGREREKKRETERNGKGRENEKKTNLVISFLVACALRSVLIVFVIFSLHESFYIYNQNKKRRKKSKRKKIEECRVGRGVSMGNGSMDG